jgi:small-conductance mechanosensitive channel
VVDIGIRSTRILTRDDIEVTVPNAVIASSKIVNETSGRHPKMRVRVKIGVAYGSDVDEVRTVLLSCVEGVEHVAAEPAPRVRFRAFGDSALLFELLTWVDEPVFRGRVLDALNAKVYKALNGAGIEIPYNKMDVYIKRDGGDAEGSQSIPGGD